MGNKVLLAFDRCCALYQGHSIHSTDGTLDIAKAVINDKYWPPLLDLE